MAKIDLSHLKPFEYRIEIKEHHLDSYGHVNNAVYLALYEEARWQFITEGGYGYAQVKESQKGPVILNLEVSFKRELTNREVIIIRSIPVMFRGKIMKLSQQMIKADGEVASEAEFTIGFMDLKLRKLIHPIDAWKKAVGLDKV